MKKSLIRQIFEGAPGDSINFALGEPVFEQPKWFINLFNPKILNNYAYTPNAGLPKAREAVNKINDYPNDIENICLTCGAEEGLFASISGAKLFLNEQKNELLIPSPYFLTYPMIAKIVGLKMNTYPIPPFCNGSITESIENNINSKTGMIILNTPANPSGLMLSENEIKKVEKLCADKNILLIIDEVYRFFGNRETPVSHNWNDIGSHSILVSSLTKNYGLPGLRLGWAYTKHNVINKIIAAHQSIAAITSSISQQLVEQFPNNDYKNWLEVNRNKTIKNRELMKSELKENGIEFVDSKGAFYVLFKVPTEIMEKMTDVDFAFHLKDNHKILTVPGSAFGEYSTGYMRLSCGGLSKDFKEGIKRIRDGIDSIKKEV